MTEQIGRLESKWTSVNGLSIYARVSVDPVPVEDSAKDLIPTGNVPGNGSCQRDCVATDCVRQARPKEVLRASAAHSSGRISSIVMVHGLVVSSRYMVPTAIRLAPYYHVYVPDLPGFGKSDKPSHVLNITELSDVLADWMQAIGLKQATLLGNSVGCQVIANLALRHPERVSRVILMGPTMDPRARMAYRVIVRWLLNAPREPLSLFPIVARDYLAAGFRRFVLTFRDALQDRIEKHLPHIRVPGLVVRGEYDTIVPERWAEEAARLLPQGQLVVIARAAHDINYDAPAELTRVVRAFMGGELS